eukprot:1140294-Pelagomonas_calceolata.AAC.4
MLVTGGVGVRGGAPAMPLPRGCCCALTAKRWLPSLCTALGPGEQKASCLPAHAIQKDGTTIASGLVPHTVLNWTPACASSRMLTSSHLGFLCPTQQRINTHTLAPLNAAPPQHQQANGRAFSMRAGGYHLVPESGLSPQWQYATLCKPFLATNPPIRKHCISAAAAPEGKPDTPQERPVKYNTEFGYSRKDVTLICAGLIALGYALYYGLQAAGMDAGMAGNWVQLAIFVGICIGWVSTYLFRVATKVGGGQTVS